MASNGGHQYVQKTNGIVDNALIVKKVKDATEAHLVVNGLKHLTLEHSNDPPQPQRGGEMKNQTTCRQIRNKVMLLKLPANDNPDPAEAIMGDTNALEAGLMAAAQYDEKEQA